jgi:hypothetical protein
LLVTAIYPMDSALFSAREGEKDLLAISGLPQFIMRKQMHTWSIVTMARAPKHQIFRWVDHHLSLGASRIYLFYDDAALAWPVEDRRVKVIICDDQHWNGSKPDSNEGRQRASCRKALRWCDSDWITFIDVDELIHGKDIGQELASVGDDVLSVLMEPYEAVYDREPKQSDAFDTRYFRRPVHWPDGRHPILWELYGTIARASTGGLWGHVRGKSFTRTDKAPGWLPIHKYKEPIDGLKVNHQINGLVLLHFDALTFVDWKEKHLRRIDGAVNFSSTAGDRRALQMQAIAEARTKGGERGLHDLYRLLNVFDDGRMERAKESGLVIEVDREISTQGVQRGRTGLDVA